MGWEVARVLGWMGPMVVGLAAREVAKVASWAAAVGW